MNLETMVNLRPTGASVGWRATGSIEQVRCQRACKEPEADLRVESAARRWVPSDSFYTPGFVLVMDDLDEILDWYVDV